MDSLQVFLRAHAPRMPLGVARLMAGSTPLLTGAVLAQQAGPPSNAPGDIASRSQLQMVIERLGGPGFVVIVIAVAVLALLLWRIVAAIRRERPVAPPARAARAAMPHSVLGGVAPITSGATDWGHDLNKRSAVTRRPALGVRRNDAARIDGATTQWPPVERASLIRQQATTPDASGNSPDAASSPYRTGFNPYYDGDTIDPRLEVEEVADTVTQAELLVQLGDPKEAMSLLSRHIRENEKPGPEVWLLLLDLYQATGRELQYNALAEGFRALFNAEVPAWAASRDVATRDLETYVQVMRKLYSTWPRPESRAYLNDLLTDNRGGSRQGFSLSAYRELLFLVKMIDTLEQIVRDESEGPRFAS